MRFWPNLIATLGLLAVSVAAGAAPIEALPPGGAVAGWSLQREPRVFTAANLYEYIDGAADLFIAYGFRELAAGEYVKQGAAGHLITVDVYDMGAPLNAFGVFASEKPRDLKEAERLPRGYASNGLVALRKGQHYLKVSVTDTSDTAAARELGLRAAERLPGFWDLPAEFDRLPTRNRVQDSERYVKKDALGHRFLTNVISAEYRVGRASAGVHIADLSSPEQARQSWQKLRDFESRAGKGLVPVKGLVSEAFAATDSGYGNLIATCQGRFLVIVTSEKMGRKELMGLVTGTLLRLGGKVAQN